MNPDVYRGPWGGSACRDSPVQADRKCSCAAGACAAEDAYAEQMEDVLRHTAPKSGIAGFFAGMVDAPCMMCFYLVMSCVLCSRLIIIELKDSVI